jgi:hypothetical protein
MAGFCYDGERKKRARTNALPFGEILPLLLFQVRAMRIRQRMVKLFHCSASFALAWTLSPCLGYADEAGSESVPAPVIVTSGRLLLRTSLPAVSQIGESLAFSPDGKTLAAGRAELSYDRDGKHLSSSIVISNLSANDASGMNKKIS